jgi:hypothetical protein
MHNTNGKTVDYLLTGTRKTCVRLSPIFTFGYYGGILHSVQSLLTPKLVPTFEPYISPPKFAFSPLVEYIFYPVSTVPITNSTKEKIKER